MPDALDSVKALAAEMRRSASTAEIDDPVRAERLIERAQAIEEVTSELTDARARLRPVTGELGDISDLPQEVLDQLNLSKIDELEKQMRDIVAAANGEEIGIDPIIVELWRRHKVTKERRFIMNKLYRMGQKEMIHPVEGKKGVYRLPRPWKSRDDLHDDIDDDIPF